jgi:hypothetical protein
LLSEKNAKTAPAPAAMTRKTLPSFGPAKPAASNVVPLAKR